MAVTIRFMKTPQASDDFYSSGSTGITEDYYGFVLLDITDDDLGGSGVSLYSLDNGDNSNDLLAGDTVGSATDYSAHGATIGITAEGAVAYDTSTWDADFQALLQRLAPGQTLQDSFTYAIQLGNGTLSWATVSVEIAGENDGPTITSDDQAGTVVEDLTLSATGQVTATDVDSGDHQHFSLVSDAAGAFGFFSVNADTGAWEYALDNDAAGFLNDTDRRSEQFTVRVTDDYGAFVDQAVAITVVGTNDPAQITGDASGTVTEAGGVGNAPGVPIVQGDLLATDVDNDADAFRVVAAGAGTANGFGTYEVLADGVWIYTLDNDNPLVNGLDTGEWRSDSFSVFSDDGTSQVVDITIRGATDNRAPLDLVVAVNQPPSGTTLPGAGAVIANLSTVDPDAGDSFTYSLVSGSAGFAVSGSSLSTVAGLNAASTYQLTLRSTDSGGLFVDQDLRIVTGTNSGSVDALDGANGDDILYALGSGDALLAGSGNDTLFGQDGSDFMDGGAGDDYLYGGALGDHYAFNLASGNDVVQDASGGNDRIDIAFGSSNLRSLNFERIDFDQDAGSDDLALVYEGQQIAVLDHYSGQAVELMNFVSGIFAGYTLRPPSIERVLRTETTGSNVSDVVASSSEAETLLGGGGFDMLFGNGGNDSINGGSENDLLVGGDGADSLDGGSENDVLFGGAGNDVLSGGLGRDRFYYDRAGDGTDSISGFAKGSTGDLLDLHDLLLTLEGYNNNAFTGGYLTFQPDGAVGTLVQIDSDGGGDDFTTLAVLSGIALGQADTANYLL